METQRSAESIHTQEYQALRLGEGGARLDRRVTGRLTTVMTAPRLLGKRRRRDTPAASISGHLVRDRAVSLGWRGVCGTRQ